MSETARNYDLQTEAADAIAAPELAYQPPRPRAWQPNIGVIGCGGISETHLAAYREAGFNVTALASRSAERANARQQAFYPDAAVYTDHRELLQRPDIDIVDIATDPAPRPGIIRAALESGKHVLSQKPFVTDLETGRELADLAAARSLKLAVNQNGRWAPHLSYLRQAVATGLTGRVASLSHTIHWDHNWIQGTPFDAIHHVVLYDFAIHWFDFVASVMPHQPAQRVTANVRRSCCQRATPPLLATVTIEYEDAVLSLIFDGDTRFGAEDRTVLRGTDAVLQSVGPSLSDQQVTGYTAEGRFVPKLEGTWFTEGFIGTMAELICAVEDDREPLNGAADNLRSLALCFAAVQSAEARQPVNPAAVTALPRTD